MFLSEAHKTLDAMLGTLKRQNGVALRVIGVGPVCNTDVYQNNKPQNWASFWNMEPFLSQCCLPAWSRFVMEAAQMADGVSKDQLHPLNMDHAFAKITEIKHHVSK